MGYDFKSRDPLFILSSYKAPKASNGISLFSPGSPKFWNLTFKKAKVFPIGTYIVLCSVILRTGAEADLYWCVGVEAPPGLVWHQDRTDPLHWALEPEHVMAEIGKPFAQLCASSSF